MNRHQRLLPAFGADPDAVYWSDAHERAAERIHGAIESRRMLGLVGRYGCGKSWLVREATQHAPSTDVAYVANPDREHIRIGHVVSAIVHALSSETPRRGVLARTYQIARLMGERVRSGRHVCVVVENAHRLHASALLKLKDLRESARYRGEEFLFSVILVGQEGLRAKLGRYGEVRERSRIYELTEEAGWMTYPHRVEYLARVYGEALSGDAREHLAALYQTPLRLDYEIEQILEDLERAGLSQLQRSHLTFSNREQRQALDLTQAQQSKAIKSATGQHVPKQSISDVENDRTDDPEREALMQAGIDWAAEAKREPPNQSPASQAPPETTAQKTAEPVPA